MVFKDVSSRYGFAGFARYNKPIFVANFFFSRFNMIFPRYIYIQLPSWELTEDFVLIMLLPIFNSSIFKGNLSLVKFLWNKV